MKAYKGFNKDFTCRGFQFEEGKEYEEEEAVLCEKGFHACTNPLDVLNYYNDVEGKYCEVELDEVSKDKKENDSKICGKRIKINAEIGFVGLFKMGIEWLKEQTIFSKNDTKELEKSSGYGAKSGASGKNSVVMCAGNYSIAKAKIGSWITLAEWGRDDNGDWIPITVVTKRVDGVEIKEDTYYKLVNGVFKVSSPSRVLTRKTG